MTPRQIKNIGIVSEAIAHFAAGSTDKSLDMLTENCTYTIGAGASESVVPYHGTHTGREGIGQYFATLQQHTIRANCGGNEDDSGAPPTPSQPAPAPAAPVAAAPPADDCVRDATGKVLVPFGNKVVVMGEIVDRFRDDRSHMHQSRFMQLWTVDESTDKISAMEMFTDTASIMQAWNART